MNKHILYTKYSNERNPQFSISTSIVRDEDGNLSVYKKPMSEQAVIHLKKMVKWKDKLNSIYLESELSPNMCTEITEGLEFEYLNGITLENKLDSLLEQNALDELFDIMEHYFEEIKKGKGQQRFIITDEFAEVFGNADLPDGLMSLPVTDIDMLFGNIMLNDKMNILDYEWTFDFPIPVNYVIFRALHYYLGLSTAREQLKQHNLYDKFGISQVEVSQYLKMEENFQNFILQDFIPIRFLYDDMSPGSISICDMPTGQFGKEEKSRLQIFWQLGETFSEANSRLFPCNEDGMFDVSFNIPDEVEWLRIDPGEHAGLLYLEDFSVNGSTIDFAVPDGWICDSKLVFFSHTDPQIITHINKEKDRIFHFCGSFEKIEGENTIVKDYFLKQAAEARNTNDILQKKLDNEKQKVCQMIEERNHFQNVYNNAQQENVALTDTLAGLQAENSRLIQQIRRMESTQIWKVYQKYRNLVEKGKVDNG